jgi:phage-related protein
VTVPISHLSEAQQLTADALVDLYEIRLKFKDVIFQFKDGPQVTWQGDIYQSMACQMSGDNRAADGEESKVTLRIMNPLGIFNHAAINGDIDLATVFRYRVRANHLANNTNIFQRRMWWVGRIPELVDDQGISLELRNMTEGPNFKVPVRAYYPPEFPSVTL